MNPRFFVLCVSLAMSGLAAAERTEVLDLAGPVVERSVPAGESIRLMLTNKLPKYQYSVRTKVRIVEIPPFKWPSELSRSAREFCAMAATLFSNSLEAMNTEEQIPPEIDSYRTRAQSCTATERAELEVAIGTTTQALDQSFTMSRGEELVVQVERDGRNWEYVLSTGGRGEWRTFYGFNFLPNEDEEFFSSQDPTDPDLFTITRKADREELDFAPSIIFNWLPASQRGRTWGHGLAVGLGFDLDNPIVFAGYGATYNENVALTAGAVFHKQKRLNGRFEEGQVIMENLDSDQLTEETFNVNFYVGIGFRFGGDGIGNPGNGE